MTVGRELDARGLLAAVAVLVALCACEGDDGAAEDGAEGDGGSSTPGGPVAWPDGDDETPTACLVGSATAEISVASIDKVDLLFAIDDSGSMGEEQAALRAQFPRLIEALTTGDLDGDGTSEVSPARSLHLGVVSSDLGLVGVSGIDNCDSLGADGVMNQVASPDVTGCSATTYPRFLSYAPRTTEVAAVANDLACIATLGTDGCHFPQQLESALKALWPSDDTRVTFLPDPQGFGSTGQGDALQGGVPGMNAGFLRNDPAEGLSVIAIVVVTDGEDCSSKSTSHFRPAQFLDPNDPTDAALLMQGLNVRCNFNPQNLYLKERYINGFKALRPGNEQLVVFGAIAGVPPEAVANIPEDFASNEAAREAFYQGIYAHALMQPMVDTQGTPSPDDDVMRASCDTSMGRAQPPQRIVEIAQGIGENGVVQSICQQDFAPAIDAIVATIGRQLGATCLPRPLVRDAEGKVGCDVVWELPAPGRAPVGTPTTCASQPFLTRPAEGQQRTADDGGERCRVAQLAVQGDDGSRAPVPSETDGMSFSDGWYYDDFSEDVLGCTTTPKQRIAFTPSAMPPSGVRVVLECLSETTSLPDDRTDIDRNVEQPSIGDPCEQVQLNGQLVSGDAACAVRLADGTTDIRMFCHPGLNVCAQECANDDECPSTWTCDDGAQTLSDTAGRAMCVPHCGGRAESASAEHVGDPCLPFTLPATGFDPREAYVETSNPDCGGGVCLVYQLEGDPTCPPGQSTDSHRCSEPFDVEQSVYCSCRCDAPEGYPECECPDGFSCVSVLGRGEPDVRGGYCALDSTIAR